MKIVLSASLLVIVIGLLALGSIWAQQAWLAPSIGAAAFAQIMSPKETSSQPYSIFLGQIIGAIAGFIGVFASRSIDVGALMGSHDLMMPRVVAVAIAVLITALGQLLTKAKTPSGGATALVVAIGAEVATYAGAFRLLVGIILVTALGEAARRLLLSAMGRFEAKPAVAATPAE